MCRVGVFRKENLMGYSFPRGHPLSSKRIEAFWDRLGADDILRHGNVLPLDAALADETVLLSFHTPEYVNFVKKASQVGTGYLDYGDTPAFIGVFEAAAFTVGATVAGLDMVMRKELDHVFNPVGGLHHARRDKAAGFCVFNDAAIAIEMAKRQYQLERILYVDIDVHHGDGVFYEFYDDPRVCIADIHEDGRYLYPGTGFDFETGEGAAKGSKMNISLPPGSGDKEFKAAFEKVKHFADNVNPQLVILQAGADGLENDPISHLRYSEEAHRHATSFLHELAHRCCDSRILALGGGGYSLENVSRAWVAVVKALVGI